MQKFIALWKHRYRKYTHLLKVYLFFIKVYLRLSWLKIRFSGKRRVVAIVLTHQIGDIIAAEPISRQVREKHPADYIIWFVKPAYRELLENNPCLDEILVEFCANQRRLLMESGIFDICYNLMFRNNSHCSICDRYIENPEADERGITIHNYYFKGTLLDVPQRIIGLPTEDITPRLYITDAHMRKVDSLQLPEKYLVIHGQSTQSSRNWDNRQWEKLIGYLISKTDFNIVEIGLSSDLQVNDPRYINLCGQLGLLETAEVIRRANMFVGIDSGPAHMANAVGTKAVIMIGKLNQFSGQMPFSGFYNTGGGAIIARNMVGPSADISIEEVIECIHQII